MPKVFHITAHLGGGAGNVLTGLARFSKRCGSYFSHELLQLEPTQNAHYVDLCQAVDIPVISSTDQDIKEKITSSDIVQIEWWHHPLTMKVMFDNLSEVPCRLIVWSHISGCHFPCTPASFVKLPERFIFSAPYSLENPTWDKNDQEKIKRMTSVVVSSGLDCEKITNEKKLHSGFNIGYVGFLDYNKLNPDFIKFCAAVDIPDAFFTVVGDTDYGKALLADIKKAGLENHFHFTGYSTNVQEESSFFDVFGYPLNPQHTGTAENALLEAMYAGIPPVVLNQCTEKYLVKNMQTGLIVNSITEYAAAMRYLYDHPEEIRRLGDNASRFVKDNYCVANTASGMEAAYNNIITMPKRRHDIAAVFGNSPHEWFLSCLNQNHKSHKDFVTAYREGDMEMMRKAEIQLADEGGLITGKSKSSFSQYAEYFPEDKCLARWADAIKLEAKHDICNYADLRP